MDRVQSFTQAYTQAPWRKQLQMIGIFLLFLVFAALVAGIYLNVTARTASIGRKIQDMQAQIDDLERENADLQSRLAALTSAGEMENRARVLGFQPIDKDQPVYIVVPGYIPRQTVILAPPPGMVAASSSRTPPEYSESVFDWLGRQALESSFPFVDLNLPHVDLPGIKLPDLKGLLAKFLESRQ